MLVNIGSKVLNATHLGQKAKSVVKKVGKVALNTAKVGAATVGVLGAIGAVSGFDSGGAKMVRSRGGLERAIRGGNR